VHPLAYVVLLAPVVDVRGHSRLTLSETVVEEDRLVLRGELRDRDLLTALPDREIELWSDTAGRVRVATDSGGTFVASLPAAQPAGAVWLRFPGDTFYLGAEIGPIRIDAPDRPPVALELRGPSEIRLGDADVPLFVAARSAGTPAHVVARLKNGAGRLLASVTTGDDPTPVRVPTRSLGPPGPVRIVATSEPSGFAVLDAMLRAPVRVGLRAVGTADVVGDPIDLEGDLGDANGPVAGAPIAVRARGQTMASGTTDARGKFRVSLDSGALSEGPVDLQAVYTPHVPWREAGLSEPLVIHLMAPRPLPVAALLAPAAILAIGLALRRPRRRRPRPTEISPPRDPGLRPVAASRLRRAERNTAGTIWDPFAGRPVSGATLTLEAAGSPPLHATADEDGRIQLSIPDGRYRATVSAPGYLPLGFDVVVPHRGELRGFRIDLLSVRARALRLWTERAGPFAPPDRLLLVTPGELAALQPALAPAALAFEEIFYSGRPADESSLGALLGAGTPPPRAA
jgi:carboxypeptidase family protein